MRVEDIHSVYSLLEDEDAAKAFDETLRRIVDANSDDSPLVKWAEFEIGGRFVRGGSTTLHGLAKTSILAPGNDPDVQALSQAVAEHGLEAGRVIAAGDNQSFYWVLPHKTAPVDEQPREQLIAIAVTEPLFDQVLQHFNAGRGLTAAERRVAYQIAAGLSLREAAALDEVGFETKRTHVKSLSGKMQCGGQTDLVRLMLGQLFYVMSATQADTWFAGETERFVSRYLADDVRLNVRRLPSGRLIRTLECGPIEGTPVFMIHGMMFPTILFDIGRHLKEASVRFIVPIRRGYLERLALDVSGAGEDLIDHTWQDLAQLIESDCEGPAPVLGQSYGGVIALRFAAHYPRHVSDLMLLSTNLARPKLSDAEFAGRFYGSLRRLSRNRAYAQMITLQFAPHYAEETSSRTALRRLFAGCAADLEVLDGIDGKPPTYGWFGDLHGCSLAGVAEDFRFTMDDWDEEVRRIQAPFRFLHGADDPLTRPDELRKFLEMNPRGSLETLPHGGHFMASSQARNVWQAVGRWAAGVRHASAPKRN